MSIVQHQPAPFQGITTTRLHIRRFQKNDIDRLVEIRSDPQVAQFQSWPAVDRTAMATLITDAAAATLGVPGQWFQFAIAMRDSDELIGDCGLHILQEDPRQAELGYTLGTAHQGQGLAQEAIGAVLTYLFDHLDLHRVAAITDVRNQGSIRLLERLHFRREGKTVQAFWNKEEWVDEYLYAMTKKRWQMLVRIPERAHGPSRTEIVLLGTGTPNPDPERHGSSVAIVARDTATGDEVQEQAYLVDCGPGVVRRAAEAAQRGVHALAMPGLTRLFLTHHHSDHTAGLPDLLLTPWVLGRNQPLVIYGPVGTKAMVDHLLAAYAEDIRERSEGLEPSNDQGHRVDVHEYTAGKIYEDKLVEVEAFQVQHGSWPAFGLRFTSADRTIVISGDTRPFDGLADHYRDCDILVHEVYSAESFQRRPPEWQRYHSAMHTSTRELASLANAVQPGLVVLVHQLFWGTTGEALLAEMAEHYDGPVISGHDLDRF